MKCPRCDIHEQDLELVMVGEVEVDQCKSCLGIWFDPNEVPELVSKDDLGELKLTGKAMGVRTVLPLTCPRDGTTMEKVNDIRVADVQLDICPECGGRWLDGGELERLRQKGLLADIKNFFVTYILPD